jgi:hypothetical protein
MTTQKAVLGAAYLREQAELCVRLANSAKEPEAIAALRNMASQYLIMARRLEEAPEGESVHQAARPLQTE